MCEEQMRVECQVAVTIPIELVYAIAKKLGYSDEANPYQMRLGVQYHVRKQTDLIVDQFWMAELERLTE